MSEQIDNSRQAIRLSKQYVGIRTIGTLVFGALVVASCGSATERSSIPGVSAHAGDDSEKIAEQVLDYDPASLVSAELVSETSGLLPGASGYLAAVLQLEPGWHIYWKNPGDSGLPTSFRISGADGLLVDPVRYPGPVRFASEGGITNYGYAGEVIFPMKVHAPDDFAGGIVTVEARWLACRKDACVPGKATTTLSLSSSASEQTSAANKIQRAIDALPKDVFSAQLGVRVSVIPEQGFSTVEIQADPGRHVEVFPLASMAVVDQVVDQKDSASTSSSSTRFRLIPQPDLTVLAIVAARGPKGQLHYLRLTADEPQTTKEKKR